MGPFFWSNRVLPAVLSARGREGQLLCLTMVIVLFFIET